MAYLSRLALLPMLLAGCGFYFGEDNPCDTYGYSDVAPAAELRNPETGDCEYQGWGGTVEPECEEYVYSHTEAYDYAYYDWGYCDSYCNDLEESSCLVADGCRAVYVGELEYAACWSTAQSGPVRGGGCEGLSAQECSTHDDCSAWHDTDADGIGNFASCVAEPEDCTYSGLVEEASLRDPYTGQCVSSTGTDDPCSEGEVDPMPTSTWGYCDSECEAYDEETCLAADACRGIYANACSPDEDCYAVVFATCWPTDRAGPLRGGECAGLDAYTCSYYDDCVAVHDRDWESCESYEDCLPDVSTFLWCEAESAPVVCDEVSDEETCIESDSCVPLYEGSDCTCDDSGCTCAEWTFISCHDAE